MMKREATLIKMISTKCKYFMPYSSTLSLTAFTQSKINQREHEEKKLKKKASIFFFVAKQGHFLNF